MKVLFVGGGTLGHIYPSLPVIKELKKENNYIIYVCGDKENEKNVISNNSYIDKKYYLKMQGFKRGFSIYNIKTIIMYFKTKKICKKIILENNPDIVIGMGGYVSGPILKMAIKLKKKTIIHEQNSVYGLVNKFFKNKVNKVLLAYNIDSGKNIYYIGNPRTSEFYNKYSRFLISKTLKKPKVFVVGGSQGAKVLNDFFIENSDYFCNNDIDLILVTGKKYYRENKELISKNNKKIKIFPFVKNIEKYLIISDLIISRAGATTISEILGLKKISILIPSPNVKNNHQYKNANYYYEKGCVEMVLESNISNELLMKIDACINDLNKRNHILKSIDKNIFINSTELFLKEIKDLLEQKC